MVVVKGFLIVLGILLLIAEEPILGIILIVVGLAVKSKKKEQPQNVQYRKQQLSRSQIEDKKRYLLNEIQMCQQRINQYEMEAQIENKTGGFEGLLGVAHLGVRMKELDKEHEYLNKLRKEYNDLSKL